jgi:hypothetical protein
MNKLVWIGVAAVGAVLLFMVWMYSMFIDSRPVPPDRSKQIDNATTSQTQTPQSPPATATAKPPSTVAEPPFNASSYEANYTVVLTVSFRGVVVTMDGWIVIGVGPAGNYSLGMITVPLRGTVTYKSATEGNTTYTMSCFHGICTIEEEEWPFTSLLVEGVNVTRTAKGQCRWSNYTGTLYEERGMLDPKAFSRFMEGMTGNYTAHICEVNGVILYAYLVSTASMRGEPVRVTLKIETVKAGTYSVDVYNRILQEIKSNK